MRPILLAIIGKPLVGKDTQADIFVAHHPDAVKISPGQILREVKAVGQSHRFWPILGSHIPEMDQGLMLPDASVLACMRETIKEKIAAGKKWIVFSGFPRTEDQLNALDAMADEIEAVSVYLHLDAEDAAVSTRLKNGRSEDRSDDTLEIMAIRLAEYRRLTQPIIDRLQDERRIIVVDGEESIEAVTRSIEQELAQTLDPEIILPVMARR